MWSGDSVPLFVLSGISVSDPYVRLEGAGPKEGGGSKCSVLWKTEEPSTVQLVYHGVMNSLMSGRPKVWELVDEMLASKHRQ